MKRFGLEDPVTFNVDLDGTALYGTLHQPPGPAAATWAAHDAWASLFPGALEPEQGSFWLDQLADPTGPVTDTLVRAIAYGLAEEVYGVPWWAAHRLCSSAVTNWLNYGSWCVTHRFRPADESADRIVASCWAWRISCLDPAEDNAGQALEDEIMQPPAGHADPSPKAAESRLAANRQMFANLGGFVTP